MSHRLDRILHVRELLERISQLELGKQTAALRSLEDAAEVHRELAVASRREACQLLLQGLNHTEEWLIDMADAELFELKRGKLIALAAARQSEIEIVRDRLLARRRDRLQVETLISDAERIALRDQVRLEQKLLDDLFEVQRNIALRRTE